jgi:hypothetical protein
VQVPSSVAMTGSDRHAGSRAQPRSAKYLSTNAV